MRRAAGWIIEHCDYPADEAERQALIRDLVNARANPSTSRSDALADPDTLPVLAR